MKLTQSRQRELLDHGRVNNLFDTHPPLGLTGIGAGSAIYDFRGRNYYAGFRARF